MRDDDDRPRLLDELPDSWDRLTPVQQELVRVLAPIIFDRICLELVLAQGDDRTSVPPTGVRSQGAAGKHAGKQFPRVAESRRNSLRVSVSSKNAGKPGRMTQNRTRSSKTLRKDRKGR